MDICAPSIPSYLSPDSVAFSVRTANGNPFRMVSRHELDCLIAEDRVRAIVRGKRVKSIYLTVPPDVAGRSMGETRRKVKDSLHTDASTTVQRSDIALPSYQKRHHLAHCLAWPTRRHAQA